MNKKSVFYILGTLSLVISLIWGITQNQKLEPWTAFLGALLYFISLFVKNDNTASSTEKGDIKQKNFLGFFNTSKVRQFWGKARQSNWLGFGNKQEIDNSKPSDESET